MPFGHHHHHDDEPKEDQVIEVANDFELLLVDIEDKVASYLESPTTMASSDLTHALKRLDDHIARIAGENDRFARYSYLTAGSMVFAATGTPSLTDEIPAPLFAAQAALVRAAKDTIDAADLDSLESLKAAYATVLSIHEQVERARSTASEAS